jgi:type 1 fimbriae regulatory protein FimE
MSHTEISRSIFPEAASVKTNPDRRKHLTPHETTALIDAAGRSGRQGARDKLLCLLLYQHGLRVSEGVNLRWSAVDFRAGTLAVRRSKRGRNSTHPLWRNEIGALRRLRKEWPDGEYVFQSERGNPLCDDMARRIIARAGKASGLAFHVHPHMLRHTCGYKLINSGQTAERSSIISGIQISRPQRCILSYRPTHSTACSIEPKI